MAKDQHFSGKEVNAQINLNQHPDEPKSAHATPVVEKYVEKRKEKAERHANEEAKPESKFNWDNWSSIKYVIL